MGVASTSVLFPDVSVSATLSQYKVKEPKGNTDGPAVPVVEAERPPKELAVQSLATDPARGRESKAEDTLRSLLGPGLRGEDKARTDSPAPLAISKPAVAQDMWLPSAPRAPDTEGVNAAVPAPGSISVVAPLAQQDKKQSADSTLPESEEAPATVSSSNKPKGKNRKASK